MLKKKEIRALSYRLRWDLALTQKCINNLYSNASRVIDQNIVKENDVDDFLRICIENEFYPTWGKSISRFFGDHFNDDPRETLLYFYNDLFFCNTIYYLEEIDHYRPQSAFSEGRDLSHVKDFYEALIESRYFVFYESLSSASGPIMVLLEKFAKRENVALIKYCLDISVDLAKDIGTRIFEADYIREVYVEYQNTNNYKTLIDLARALMSYAAKRRTGKEYIYTLCERLWREGYGRRESFKIAAAAMNKPVSSMHRRFYDAQKELKKKKLRYEDLIADKKMRSIDSVIREVKSCSGVNEYINKQNMFFKNLSRF